MSNHAAMPIHWGDLLKDCGHLTTGELGAYLLLLARYWTDKGPLRDEERFLARVAGLRLDHWRRMAATLLELFERRDGTLVHKRVERDLETLRARQERAAEARAKRAGRGPRGGGFRPKVRAPIEGDYRAGKANEINAPAERIKPTTIIPLESPLPPLHSEHGPPVALQTEQRGAIESFIRSMPPAGMVKRRKPPPPDLFAPRGGTGPEALRASINRLMDQARAASG